MHRGSSPQPPNLPRGERDGVWSVRVRSTAFRGDVEGLRAIAVRLVLLYHAGLPFLPGGYAGVDIFFVISGFLITSQLISEVERTGRVSLPRFYARRAKRLLPAAGVVLAVTAALTYLFLPRIRWQEIGGDIASAALYLVNWRLADRSVDYLAEDSEASPVQHFWSLAVEEQYYLVWPLVIVAGAIARAVRSSGVLSSSAWLPSSSPPSSGRCWPHRTRPHRRTSSPPPGSGSWGSVPGWRWPRAGSPACPAWPRPRWAGPGWPPSWHPGSGSPPRPCGPATPLPCRPWGRLR